MKTFKDYPSFKPDLSPKDCIKSGIFGGVYFNPVGGSPGILSKQVKINHTEFPKSWFSTVPTSFYLSKTYNPDINKYKVYAGKNQAYWESKNWISPQDPRGWFQWYCRFYHGRRSEDDTRQIKRWDGVCGENGRWRKYLENMVKNGKDSPKIRQTLLHWGCTL